MHKYTAEKCLNRDEILNGRFIGNLLLRVHAEINVEKQAFFKAVMMMLGNLVVQYLCSEMEIGHLS